MRKVLLTSLGLLVVAASAGSLTSRPLVAQAPSAAAKRDAGPRTPDGHPDLTGFYNVATITPVERPAEYGNRLVLTDAEAAAMEKYEVQRNQKDLEPSAANRTAPPVGGDKTPDEVVSGGALPRWRRRGRRLQPGLDQPGRSGRHGGRTEAHVAHRRSGRRQSAGDEARSAQAQHRVPGPAGQPGCRRGRGRRTERSVRRPGSAARWPSAASSGSARHRARRRCRTISTTT